MSESSFIHEIKHLPGYDYRDNPEKRKFGKTSPHILYICRNGKGAVVLDVTTGWYALDPWDKQGNYTVRIHWHIPSKNRFEDLKWSTAEPQDCDIIHCKCVGSSTSIHAEDWMKLLCFASQEVFRSKMEQLHAYILHMDPSTEMKYPDLTLTSDMGI